MQTDWATLVYLTRASPAERLVREWAAQRRRPVRFCEDAFDLLAEALQLPTDAPTSIVLEGLLLEPGAAAWVERLHRRLPQAVIVLLDARRADERGPVPPWLLPCSTPAALGPLLERCLPAALQTPDRLAKGAAAAELSRRASAAAPSPPPDAAAAAPAASGGASGHRPRAADVPTGAIDLDTLTREELAALLENLEDTQSTGGPAVA